MKRALFLLLLAGVMYGCDNISDLLDADCTSVGKTSILLEVRDEGGRPIAIGATVSAWNQDGVRGYGLVHYDSLHVSVLANNETGKFTVQVTKPWYKDVLVQGVEVSGGKCGVERPAVVPVTLRLEPGAPPVRQVVLYSGGAGLGDGNLSVQLAAYVEAAEEISRAVVWAADTAVVELTQDGLITSRCLTENASTWVTAWSAVDPTKRDSVDVSVRASPAGSSLCP